MSLVQAAILYLQLTFGLVDPCQTDIDATVAQLQDTSAPVTCVADGGASYTITWDESVIN